VIASLIDVTSLSKDDDKVSALRRGQWTSPNNHHHFSKFEDRYNNEQEESELQDLNSLRNNLIQSLMKAIQPLDEHTHLIELAEANLNDELETLSSKLKRKLSFKHLRVGALGALEYLVELPANVSAPDGWTIVNSTQQVCPSS
jgi:hypothetical protein